MDSREHIGTSGTLNVEYGITRRLQTSFDVPYGITEEESQETATRWGTAGLGLRYQIIRDSSIAVSVGMSVGVPARRGAETEYQPTILVAKSFRKAQVHASLSAIAESDERPSFLYNVAGVFPVRSHWFPTMEFNGRSLHARDAFYLTPGLFRRFGNRLQCGVGVPLSAGGTAGRAGVVAKIVWEVGGEHSSD